MSQEQVSKLWYSEDDYNDIKRGIRQTIRSAKAQSFDSSKKEMLCFRGLEQYASLEINRQRKTEVEKVIGAVLFEVHCQQMSGSLYDYGAIAHTSTKLSESARKHAARVGAMDAATVTSSWLE